jgi:uncharacterized protein YndB with AHSA1/START domain
MGLDVSAEVVIKRPREVVAEYCCDPDNTPKWYLDIKSIERKTPGPLAEGAQIAFVAEFLGRRMSYTYEVVKFVPGEKLVMRTSAGPFPMETRYKWESTADGGTRMKLRNKGKPTGFSSLAAPFLEAAMKNANRDFLARLKELLEGS